MKAKLPVWLWGLSVAAAVVLAVREVTWLDERIADHRARHRAQAIARGTDAPVPGGAAHRRHFPIPISGFGPL